MTKEHLTTEQLEAELPQVLASPQDGGEIEMIVSRPAPGQRVLLTSASLSPEGGLEGDRWASETKLRLPDGRPDGRDQVSLMNSRLLRKMAAGDDQRMALAGDNLVVDLDVSVANLPPGQRLRAGRVLLEITEFPHTGCAQFAERFGPDAVRYINASQRKELRLRGVFARVLQGGTLQVGDRIWKAE